MIPSTRLLPILLALLASRGLAADSLEPWHAWVTFKEFARRVDEAPDPGVAVQLNVGHENQLHLQFLGQVVTSTDDWVLPVGGVVCELTFSAGAAPRTPWSFWSWDCRTFDRFVDIVERHPPFADLLVQRPESTAVYWETAPDLGAR